MHDHTHPDFISYFINMNNNKQVIPRSAWTLAADKNIPKKVFYVKPYKLCSLENSL